MLDRLFVAFQYLLPKYALTAAIWHVARIRSPWFKNLLIRRFIGYFNVDADDVKEPIPDGFENFNAFFVRELVDGARPIDSDTTSIVSPVDGTVSAAGGIRRDQLLQAKGLDYSISDLLATDTSTADSFTDGHFATIYLAPYNYHRVHSPWNGELVAARYVPGDLYSVNQATAAHVPGLFRRNERLVMHFRTVVGPAALVFVGALNVGSITTPWTGEIRPRKSGIVDALDISGHPVAVERGALLGWFNMGSTVVLLMPRGSVAWQRRMHGGQVLRMGESIGRHLAEAP